MTLYRTLHPASAPRSRTQKSTNEASRRPAHPLVNLQRQLGNGVVSRMIAQREAMEGEELEEEEFDTALALHDPALQREALEEEEMAMAIHDGAMQRIGEEEELAMGLHDVSQREAVPQVGLEGGPVGDDLQARIDGQRGAGSPLSPGFQAKMESSLGTSLDSVRVHQGSESDALNRSISAKAFTTGSDIFLRNDVSPSDEHTMAHEVAHVVQQRTMDTSAVAPSSSGMTVGPADSSFEKEADEFASAALNGSALPEREEA